MRPPPERRPATRVASEVAAERVPLGRITAAVGLKGWVKVHSDTEPRIGIVAFDHWLLSLPGRRGDSERRIQVLEGREQGKTIVARLEGIEDRDTAQALAGQQIAVSRDMLPPLDGDAIYWTDLIGMEVFTAAGLRIGTVTRLFETGANDVVVVADERTTSKAGAEVLVPWIRPDVIVALERDARRIVVDWDPDF